MKRLSTLTVRENKYELVYMEDVKMYGAIHHKYITNGKLNQGLNGLQMFCADTLADTIQRVKNQVEINHLISQGFSAAEAMSKVFGLPLKVTEKMI